MDCFDSVVLQEEKYAKRITWKRHSCWFTNQTNSKIFIPFFPLHHSFTTSVALWWFDAVLMNTVLYYANNIHLNWEFTSGSVRIWNVPIRGTSIVKIPFWETTSEAFMVKYTPLPLDYAHTCTDACKMINTLKQPAAKVSVLTGVSLGQRQLSPSPRFCFFFSSVALSRPMTYSSYYCTCNSSWPVCTGTYSIYFWKTAWTLYFLFYEHTGVVFLFFFFFLFSIFHERAWRIEMLRLKRWHGDDRG